METISRQIELRNRQVTIKIDEESLRELVQECVNAIRETHKDFTYSGNLTSITVNSYGIHVIMANELIKGPNLEVDIYWADINYMQTQPFEILELSGGVFPDVLGSRVMLNVQKHIVRKIWEEYKNNGR